jgi:hypothetical protein
MDLNPDVTAIATLALAILTGWLAWETRKMSRAAGDALEMQSEPFLGLKRLFFLDSFLDTGARLQLCLELNNPGQVRINYEVESLDYSFQGTPATSPNYPMTVGVLHPGAEEHFRCASVIFARGKVAVGLHGELKFRINFWSTLERVHHFEARVRFFVAKVTPDRIALGWVYLEGPRFS